MEDLTVKVLKNSESMIRYFIPVLFMQAAWLPTYGVEVDSLRTENLRLAVKANVESPADTTSSVELNEVVVRASRIYTTSDGMVYVPSKREKNISFSSISLLEAMGIPSLTINPQSNGVSTISGEPVRIYIDYQPASADDLTGMRPADVKKVEVLDSPSDPRFHGDRHVVNFIMVKYLYGGYTKVDANQFTSDIQGTYSLKSKMAYKRMTYDVGVVYSNSFSRHAGTDSRVDYLFPEGKISKYEDVKDAESDSHNGYATMRAIYQDYNKSVANTLGFTLNRIPRNQATSSLRFEPEIQDFTSSETESDSRNNGFSYTGNWFFSLPHALSLTITPDASYSKSTRHESYSIGSDLSIVNDIEEKSWSGSLDATLRR